MKYFQGDIVLVPFPFSNQSGSKARPAVVVSGPTLNKSNDVMLAMITSNATGNNFQFLFSNKDIERPLDYASAVKCDRLFVAEKTLIHKRISKFNAKSIELIIEKVKSVFD